MELLFVVAHWAPNCAPMRSIVRELAAEIAVSCGDAGALAVREVDLSDPSSPAELPGLASPLAWLPTLLVMRDGAEIARFEGQLPKREVGAALRELLAM